ncbi:hypothetical protein MTO96_011854 [Rhipicephalus appendiculatus]
MHFSTPVCCGVAVKAHAAWPSCGSPGARSSRGKNLDIPPPRAKMRAVLAEVRARKPRKLPPESGPGPAEDARPAAIIHQRGRVRPPRARACPGSVPRPVLISSELVFRRKASALAIDLWVPRTGAPPVLRPRGQWTSCAPTRLARTRAANAGGRAPPPSRVHIKSSFIMNGVCVRYRGWIDLDRLDGVGCLEYDEERGRLEDAVLRDQIECYNQRLRDFEEKQRAFRARHERQAEAELEARRKHQELSPDRGGSASN